MQRHHYALPQCSRARHAVHVHCPGQVYLQPEDGPGIAFGKLEILTAAVTVQVTETALISWSRSLAA